MAARVKKIRHDENTRSKIQVGNIITRLHGLIAGTVDMPPHAVSAALGLLTKVLPDVTSVEINKEVTVSYIARMPQKQTSLEQWEKNYVGPADKTLQ